MKPAWFDFTPPNNNNNNNNRVAETGTGLESTTGSTDMVPIPWAKMWSDDKLWLPLIWDQRKFIGRADFSEFGDVTKGTESEGEGASMLRWWFATVDPEVVDGGLVTT
jgi:hypothetical protein